MKTILIVDDEQNIQSSLSEVIKNQLRYKAVVAEDGETAIDILDEVKPDLILLDVVLPRIGGFALFKSLSHSKKWRDIPVIFMSGIMTDDFMRQEGINMGAVDYLTKPFVMNDLLKIIKTTLQN